MPTFEGDVVLVTGASRGLGSSIAQAFHREGARVVLNYLRNESKATKLADELEAIAVQADVTDLDQVGQLFQTAERHYGRPISVVVNNALGNFQFNGDARSKIREITWDDFDAQLRTAVQGALNTTKAALSGFEKLGHGRIINIGSNLVQNPVVPYQDYTTAKGALLAFTRTTAAELGPLNITCNMVAGGLLKMTDASAATPEAVFEQVKAITPLRKFTTPEDLTGAVLFFASPWASAVTGQQIIVDGGLCMS